MTVPRLTLYSHFCDKLYLIIKNKNHFRLSKEEKQEIDRRIEKITKHPETLISWEKVKAKMNEIAFAKKRLEMHKQNPSEGMSFEEFKKKIHKKQGF